MNKKVILSTDFKDLKLFKRGKVRDVYDLDDKLLIVSTDRISCFDVVLPSGIPFKGKVLTCISDFWFDYTKDLVKNHIVMTEVDKFPDKLKKYRDVLSGRSMLVDKTKSLAVECVVRGYLSGSGWKEYKEKNEICGIKLPKGLKESMQLPEPIFTPSTKADVGHDMNVRQDYVENLLGKDMADELREISIALYKKASSYAIKHGIIIADTKFEFGLDNNNEVILIDEALTPDSSRFWPLEEYVPGRQQPSFDKQFVRDYLESLNWNKNPPAPELPEEIIKTTSEKYLQAYKMLTGRELQI